MSTESNTSNTAHTIRMSEQDWNELLVTAVNAGYKSRTEYIRATLDRGRIEQSALPPAEIAPDNPRLMTPKIETEIRAELAARSAKIQQLETKWQETLDSLEVYSSDAAKFLTRAEEAEAKVAQLQTELQAATLPIMENPQSLNHELDAANAEVARLRLLVQDVAEGKSHRSMKEIVSDMPEKTRAKWETEKWKAETWVKYFLDNA